MGSIQDVFFALAAAAISTIVFWGESWSRRHPLRRYPAWVFAVWFVVAFGLFWVVEVASKGGLQSGSSRAVVYWGISLGLWALTLESVALYVAAARAAPTRVARFFGVPEARSDSAPFGSDGAVIDRSPLGTHERRRVLIAASLQLLVGVVLAWMWPGWPSARARDGLERFMLIWLCQGGLLVVMGARAVREVQRKLEAYRRNPTVPLA